MVRRTQSVIDLFFTLLKAGLWEKSVRLLPFEPIDFTALYNLADEQSVVGLIAAGLEHVVDRKVTKQEALPFLKRVFSIETRNAKMNDSLGGLVNVLKNSGLTPVLIKGQGVAQCYERPLWRASGDIDLLLNGDSFDVASVTLAPLSSYEQCLDSRSIYKKHKEFKIDELIIEIHGTLRTCLSKRLDNGLDEMQGQMFDKGLFRRWEIGEEIILLPSPDNDVIIVFAHILQHFFKGGIGLRQICDWSRLLYRFHDRLDYSLLEQRLVEMGILSEWKVFGCFAVEYLGLPQNCQPLYNIRYLRRARRMLPYILTKGNFGHNIDNSYYSKTPILLRKQISLFHQVRDSLSILSVFPIDSIRFLFNFIKHGIKSTINGE